MPTLTLLVDIVLVVLVVAIRQEEEIKGIQIGKEEVKLLLFADSMVLYIENLKDSIKKLLVNEFGNVAGYTINTHKSMAFLYTNNELTEIYLKNPIYHGNKKINIPRNKFNQGSKDLYSEKYRI